MKHILKKKRVKQVVAFKSDNSPRLGKVLEQGQLAVKVITGKWPSFQMDHSEIMDQEPLNKRNNLP